MNAFAPLGWPGALSTELAYFLAINLIRFLVAARSRLAFDKNVPYRAAAHRRGLSDWDRHL